MAPTRATVHSQNKSTTTIPVRTITTRTQKALAEIDNVITKPVAVAKDVRIKRKAEISPQKDKGIKRSALGNITNAIGKSLGVQQDLKRPVKKIAVLPAKSISHGGTLRTHDTSKVVPKADIAVKAKPATLSRAVVTRASLKKAEEKTVTMPENVQPRAAKRRSLEVEKSDESSLYISALEEISEGSANKIRKIEKITEENECAESEKLAETKETVKNVRLNLTPKRTLPDGVQWDFDVENWHDPYQVSQYAMDIFEYLKSREKKFHIGDYMDRQVCLSRWMRSLLVDWMVEVQESFELNHETLYLAVKLVDLYLSKVTVGKETLQLLGAASLFIASKFDERIPPMVEDFLYICDGAYSQRELLRMEMNVLKIIDFDLGIPLSYRFLRRYARCAKVSMPTLTLARYILEHSLMDYATINLSDSKLAAAALYLALQMKDVNGWSKTLEYYTSYTLDDIRDVVIILNESLHQKPRDALATIRDKYSHKIFFEVARVPLKDNLDI